LFAVAIMAVIARTLMALSKQLPSGQQVAPASPSESRCTVPEPQFKHAIFCLGQDAAALVADNPQRALDLFAELLEQIGNVKYYRPRNPRPAQPRVNKQNISKWIRGRAAKMNAA